MEKDWFTDEKQIIKVAYLGECAKVMIGALELQEEYDKYKLEVAIELGVDKLPV